MTVDELINELEAKKNEINSGEYKVRLSVSGIDAYLEKVNEYGTKEIYLEDE